MQTILGQKEVGNYQMAHLNVLQESIRERLAARLNLEKTRD